MFSPASRSRRLSALGLFSACSIALSACSGGNDESEAITPFPSVMNNEPLDGATPPADGQGDDSQASEDPSQQDDPAMPTPNGEGGVEPANGVGATGGMDGGSASGGDNAGVDDAGEPNADDGMPTPVSAEEPGESEPGTDEPVVEPARLDAILVFSATAGFRHDSIGNGLALMDQLGQSQGFAVTATENPNDFNDDNLAQFDVVVWLSTTGDVLGAQQQAAFERYIQAGGGYVGIHSAADTEYGWAWYGALLGNDAYFVSHPEIQTASVSVEAEHPSTAHLAQSFQIQDEWYNYRNNPRSSVEVLLTLDENSYNVGPDAMGADHPIAWYHEFDGGRAWYTGLGHRAELYTDPVFTQHVLGGIRWAAGVAQ